MDGPMSRIAAPWNGPSSEPGHQVIADLPDQVGYRLIMTMAGFPSARDGVSSVQTALAANEMACALKIAAFGRKLGRTGASIWKMSA
jgi:hypothetical protein